MSKVADGFRLLGMFIIAPRVTWQSSMTWVVVHKIPEGRFGDWCLEKLYHRWHNGHFPIGSPCRRCGL